VHARPATAQLGVLKPFDSCAMQVPPDAAPCFSVKSVTVGPPLHPALKSTGVHCPSLSMYVVQKFAAAQVALE
jgi:hypothetical protein